jgi:hypothetical protein
MFLHLSLNFPRVMFCSRDGHSNIPISIYCTGDACKKSVCTTCWIDDHKNPEEHSQQDIKEKFNEEMNMLKDKGIFECPSLEQNITRGKFKGCFISLL